MLSPTGYMRVFTNQRFETVKLLSLINLGRTKYTTTVSHHYMRELTFTISAQSLITYGTRAQANAISLTSETPLSVVHRKLKGNSFQEFS